MNEIVTTVVGNLVANPRLSLVGDSFKTTFRIASTPRWFNPKTGDWQDGTTTYVSVNCWRKLAENANDCLRKGQQVIVYGRLTQREYETKEGERRTSLEIDATSCGHDLSRTMSVVRYAARNNPEGTEGTEGGAGDGETQTTDVEAAIEPGVTEPGLAAELVGDPEEDLEEELVGV